MELFRGLGGVALAVALLLGNGAAWAQLPPLDPSEQPEAFVREALATPYGKGLAAELGRMLQKDADTACLPSKNVTAAQLPERGDALIAMWGARGIGAVGNYFDEKVFAEKFAEVAGAGAAAELKALRESDGVKRYVAIERSWRLAKVLDFLFEQFDRYVVVRRIKLSGVYPLATGNEALLKLNPAEDLEAQAEAVKEKDKSPQLDRFFELFDAAADAREASLKPEAQDFGPGTLFGGIENDLADLCIGKR